MNAVGLLLLWSIATLPGGAADRPTGPAAGVAAVAALGSPAGDHAHKARRWGLLPSPCNEEDSAHDGLTEGAGGPIVPLVDGRSDSSLSSRSTGVAVWIACQHHPLLC